MIRLLMLLTHLTLLLGVASAGEVTFPKTNGIYTAKLGVICTTRESYGTIFMMDFDRAEQMIASGDTAAMKKFKAEKRMIDVRAGVVVQIEERIDYKIKVRPKGETVSLWMPAYGVDCGSDSTPDKAKAKKNK
jgi:hypothetical protein